MGTVPFMLTDNIIAQIPIARNSLYQRSPQTRYCLALSQLVWTSGLVWTRSNLWDLTNQKYQIRPRQYNIVNYPVIFFRKVKIALDQNTQDREIEDDIKQQVWS